MEPEEKNPGSNLILSESNLPDETDDDAFILPQPSKDSSGAAPIVRIIGLVIAGVVLVVLLVLAARWIYHKAHQNNTKPTSTTKTTPAAPSTNQPAQGAPTSPGTTTPPSSSSQNAQLPNNGPGDVAAIFIGSSLAAAGLHYIITIRRFNKSGV